MILTFVDIDETLFKTIAKISVVKGNKTVRRLSNTEYNTYTLKDGESFDYSEFRCSDTFKKSEPIQNMIDIVKELRSKGREVIIISARGDLDCKDSVLNYMIEHGIDVGHYKDNKIHIIRCGNKPGKPAQRKQDIISNILRKRPEIKEIELYDDSIENLEYVSKIDIKSTMYHVTHDKIKIYKGEKI
jgi:predicted secreted acid phosphatase